MPGIIEQKVTEIIAPSVGGMGYRIVRVRLQEKDGRRTLQIMAERTDGSGMKVEDCETISHQASAVLDVHDPITGAYHLEVSSPGIDRPLIDAADFTRFIGFEAKMETDYPIDGRKRYRGILKGFSEDMVEIDVEKTRFRVPLEAIANAKLILTDELIEWYQKEYAPVGGKEAEGGMI